MTTSIASFNSLSADFNRRAPQPSSLIPGVAYPSLTVGVDVIVDRKIRSTHRTLAWTGKHI